MLVHPAECYAAGLDPKQVERIARGLSKYAAQAQALGLTLFGGGAGGTLRARDGHPGALVVATLDGRYDGGDGAMADDDEGLLRGEYA